MHNAGLGYFVKSGGILSLRYLAYILIPSHAGLRPRISIRVWPIMGSRSPKSLALIHMFTAWRQAVDARVGYQVKLLSGRRD